MMSIEKLPENEKPNSAATVNNTLVTVTVRVPNLCVSLSDKRLETIVPPDITMEIIPINETDTPSSVCMTGQPAPSSESGSPRLMNAK